MVLHQYWLWADFHKKVMFDQGRTYHFQRDPDDHRFLGFLDESEQPIEWVKSLHGAFDPAQSLCPGVGRHRS